MFCRFEDRLAGRALQLDGARGRIAACSAAELDAALAAVDSARRQGRWVALLLDFELGEWLLPLRADTPQRAENREGSAAPHARGMRGGAPASPPSARRPRLRALVFDRARWEPPWTSASSDDLDDAAAIARPEHTTGIGAIAPGQSRQDYLAQIEAIREGIERGDFYQVNYTFPLQMEVRGDRRALYRRIATRNPAAHAAYIEDDEETILSFSPELFVARHGGTLATRPMKGTAPRDADPARDHALGQELLASVKNRAENLMIVDLLRNDLGRIARPGGVRVESLFTLERYPTVWTMTSTVVADVPDATLADVLRALFPCGSVTGAPKIAAIEYIRRNEAAPRGLYCGSIGWLAPDGDFSLNVAIRTLVVDAAGRGVYGVGGGIVHDSDPASEWEECLWKARVLSRT